MGFSSPNLGKHGGPIHGVVLWDLQATRSNLGLNMDKCQNFARLMSQPTGISRVSPCFIWEWVIAFWHQRNGRTSVFQLFGYQLFELDSTIVDST
jgi:hypothetical protein